MRKLNIGLLGAGNMGRTHAYALNSMKYFYHLTDFEPVLAGVCTRHIESARRFAQEYGIGRACDCEDELINDPSIDIIDVSTPNVFHYDTLKKAIAAGKHIYCEKPLCVTGAQAEEVAALAKEAGVTAQIVFNVRHMLPMQRARQLIEAGRLGRILSFRAVYLHSSCTDLTRSAGWKQDSTVCGGGVLFDLGSHVIDLVSYLCGPFASVTSRAQIAYPLRRGMDGAEWCTNADEAFYMLASLACGAMGTIEVSKITLGTNDDLRIEINGETGALRFDLMEPNWLWFYDGSRLPGADHNHDAGGEIGWTRIECVGRYPEPGYALCGVKAPIGWLRGHVTSYYSFLRAVCDGTPAVPSFDDAAQVQRVMEDAYRSAGFTPAPNL